MTYAYDKIALDPPWRGRLKNLFQYLTQAVAKVDRMRDHRFLARQRAEQE